MGGPFNPVSVLYDSAGNEVGFVDGTGKPTLYVADTDARDSLVCILDELKWIRRHLNDMTGMED